jgi:uncharacterized phage protein gp47/JayE
MQLPLQTFATLVQNMAAAVQSAATTLIDLTVGSVLRAILEANASVALWMQWLILLVLQTTRAATSNGPDLDSWMADMSLIRLPAVPAVGMVTFSRYATTVSAVVPSGALVKTTDGVQTFSVTIDTTNAAWTATLNGYTIAAGQSALTVPIAAQVAGSAGNVLAGSITLLATAIPGVDLVTNAAPTQNGADAETDAAFRARFANYISSRARATITAIQYAISSVQQNLDFTVVQNIAPTGNTQLGNFVVTVDDGTGYPPPTLIATVYGAVDAVRPIGSTFSVQPPSVIQANISLMISVTASAQKPQLLGPVAAALTSFINALPIGQALPITRIAQIAYDTSTSITNVTFPQINGEAADLVPGAAGVIKSGTISVN